MKLGLLVVGAAGKRPVPSRTRKLSLLAPMVLGGRPPGRVGHRQETLFYCTIARLLIARLPAEVLGRFFVVGHPESRPSRVGLVTGGLSPGNPTTSLIANPYQVFPVQIGDLNPVHAARRNPLPVRRQGPIPGVLVQPHEAL